MQIASKKYNNPFASNLRKLIAENNTTIKAVSDNIGITRQAVSQYCDGHTQPNADNIIKIAKHFNVSADYLLGLSDITSTDVETQDICKKLSCPDEMLPIIRKLFVGFCPRSYVYNEPSDFAISYGNSDNLACFFEYKAKKSNDENRESKQKTSLQYFVLKSVLGEEQFFDKLCEAIYKRAVAICAEEERDEIEARLSEISDATSDEYSRISGEYCDLLEECREFEESADACEWKLQKMLTGIIEDITEKFIISYYISEGNMYDRATGKKVAKCFNSVFEFGEFEEYEKWRKEKDAEKE